jgi:hypothetical protein
MVYEIDIRYPVWGFMYPLWGVYRQFITAGLWYMMGALYSSKHHN